MSALLSENLKAAPVVNNVGSLNTFLWRRKFSGFLQTSALWSWVWGSLSLCTLRKQLAWVEASPFEKITRETEALGFLRGETLWLLAMFSTLDKQQLRQFTWKVRKDRDVLENEVARTNWVSWKRCQPHKGRGTYYFCNFYVLFHIHLWFFIS